MTFTCYECNTPMVLTRATLKLISAQKLPIYCPKCASQYRIVIEQLSAPTGEMREKLRKERQLYKSVDGKTTGAGEAGGS